MIRTELVVHLPNSPGTISRLCQALADERVNILALQIETGGTLRLVVDNHVHAAGVLRGRHQQVEEREVLYTIIPNDPGTLGRLTSLIAGAGINIEYLYASAVEGGTQAAIVIGVADARRASAAAGI
ncbi:MAG: ACT domain-containing protein [Acidobacteria bacterium]|nr:ACT domain-containing protein [Acidobacteriota bacterium]